VNYIKHFIWFIKESYSFMQGYNKIWITVNAIPKAFGHARFMSKWDRMTPEQREAWYVSG
jgi:hypothetical protein